MSYYYEYYIGYRLDRKIFPLGPYDSNGKLCPIISRSRSYASDLHELFYTMDSQAVSDALRSAFSYTDYEGKERINVKFLPLSELTYKSPVKDGYFLIDDVITYINADEDAKLVFDGFWDRIPPEVYAVMASNEKIFGTKKQLDDDGAPIVRNASDYMYYAYLDYQSQEYEAMIIRSCANALSDSFYKDEEIVILETEG